MKQSVVAATLLTLLFAAGVSWYRSCYCSQNQRNSRPKSKRAISPTGQGAVKPAAHESSVEPPVSPKRAVAGDSAKANTVKRDEDQAKKAMDQVAASLKQEAANSPKGQDLTKSVDKSKQELVPAPAKLDPASSGEEQGINKIAKKKVDDSGGQSQEKKPEDVSPSDNTTAEASEDTADAPSTDDPNQNVSGKQDIGNNDDNQGGSKSGKKKGKKANQKGNV